jgi:uracil phosphoribosyltransferase
MTIAVSNHPLVAHKISLLRDKTTKSKQFREVMHEIGLLMGVWATNDLDLEKTKMVPSLHSYK